MTNKEFVTIMVSDGYINKTEFANKFNLEYDKFLGVLHGRKRNEAVLQALATIGITDNDLPLD